MQANRKIKTDPHRKPAAGETRPRRSKAAARADRTADDTDRRLDAELADSFPASDPPSILRGGPASD
jgi:hypothetical protein